jgi:hypothetical protein
LHIHKLAFWLLLLRRVRELKVQIIGAVSAGTWEIMNMIQTTVWLSAWTKTQNSETTEMSVQHHENTETVIHFRIVLYFSMTKDLKGGRNMPIYNPFS